MEKGPYEVMDLKALRCFWAMARHRSFTRAGIELGISEAAVSQRVKALEAYLGIKLYESRGGRVRLTPAGERTRDRATVTFDELAAFERSIVDADENVELTVCTYDSVLRFLLPEAIERFAQAHPLARLRILVRATEECVRMVHGNEADLGIAGVQSAPSDLVVEQIASYPGYIILPKGHPLARDGACGFWSRLDEATVQRYPLIVFEGQAQAGVLRAALERLRLSMVVGLEVSTIDTLKHCVERGLGIAALSGLCLLDEDRSRFEILEVPAEVGGRSDYALVLRARKHRSAPLETLLGLVREVAGRSR